MDDEGEEVGMDDGMLACVAQIVVVGRKVERGKVKISSSSRLDEKVKSEEGTCTCIPQNLPSVCGSTYCTVQECLPKEVIRQWLVELRVQESDRLLYQRGRK